MKWKPSKQPLLTRKAGSTGFTTGKLNPQPPPPNPSVATYCKTHSMGEATNQHQTEGLEQFSELRCSLTATAQRENWPYSILGRWTDWVKKKKVKKTHTPHRSTSMEQKTPADSTPFLLLPSHWGSVTGRWDCSGMSYNRTNCFFMLLSLIAQL